MSGTLPHELSRAISSDVALEATTQDALSAFARRRRLLLVLRGLAGALVCWFLGVLLVVLADQLWWLSDAFRWGLSLCIYLVAGAAAWFLGVREARSSDLRQLARQLESTEPRLQGQLLSAVELADPALANGSSTFRRRLQRRVSQRIGSIPLQRLLPIDLIRRWLWAAASVFAVCVILVGVPTLEFGRRLGRAALPGARIERASLTKIEILRPSPHSQQVAEGDSVGVVAAIGGEPAQEVFLRWRSDAGADGEMLMQPRDRSTVAEWSDDDTRLLVAANLPVETGAVHYRVIAGDAITLWHTLTPQPRPHVTGFEIRYRYPEYTQLPDRVESADDGDLEALVGTTAEVTVDFDVPVRDPLLRFGSDGVEVPLEPIDDGSSEKIDRRFLASIPIKTPGVYQIDATSREAGIDNPFSPQYSITPVVDSPPQVRWSEEIQESTLVSPLERIALGGLVEDEMPVDEVMIEYQVNDASQQRRRLPGIEPAAKLPVSFEWDLLHMDGEPENDEAENGEPEEAAETRLNGGDRVRTRLVARDRQGNIGRSRVIELLVVDEGFDSDRHAHVHRRGQFVGSLVEWLAATGELATELASDDDDADAAVEIDGQQAKRVQQQIAELRESAVPLRQDLHQQLADTSTAAEMNTLELIGLGIEDIDDTLARLDGDLHRVVDAPERDPNPIREPTLKQRRERLRSVSNPLESLARGQLSHDLSKAMLSDLVGLHDSLRPLAADDSAIPVARFGRHLQIASERLDEIDRLLERYADQLVDSTRQHHDGWFRFSDPWNQRLEAATEASPDPNRWRALVRELTAELDNQTRQAPHDGRLLGQLVQSGEKLQRELGWIADRIRESRRFGEQWLQFQQRRDREQQDRERGASKLAELNRDASTTGAAYEQSARSVARFVSAMETIHRKRPKVDLAYAADLKLLGRAWENVTAEGYATYQNESPGEVFENIARAMETLESRHRAGLRLGELQKLVAAERYSDQRVVLELEHPLLIARYQTGLNAITRQLIDGGAEREWVQPIDQTLTSPAFKRSRDQVNARRWQDGPVVPVDRELVTIERPFREALKQLDPLTAEARKVLARYVSSLPEQARQAAEQAEAARDRAREREESDSETIQQVAAKHEEAKRSAEETIDSLRDVANNANPLDADQRELARDADAAAAAIGETIRESDQALREADEAGDESQAGEALDRSADSHEEMADTLRQTADHFERADAGESLAETGEQLRPASTSDEPETELEQRRRETEQLAEQAQESPQQRLEKLEEELPRNEPMRESLDEIAERGAEVALRALERSAREEQTVHRALENADGVFLEHKRAIQQRLGDLVAGARDVEGNLLKPAEQASDWSNDPDARPLLHEARQELSAAADAGIQVSKGDPALEELTRSAARLAQAIDQATESVEQAETHARAHRDDDLHGNAERRNQTAADMKRIARDSRRGRAQDAKQRKQQWSREKARALKQIQESQKGERQAAKRREQAAERLNRNPDDETAQRQMQHAERQADLQRRISEAARQSREFAQQREQEAEEASQSIARRELEPLERPNPAAELATRLSAEAAEELGQLREHAGALNDDASIDDQLRIPAEQAERLEQSQHGIVQSVTDAVEQLNRAARHQDRLGNAEVAVTLATAAEAVAEKSARQTAAAQTALAEAGEDPAHSPAASQAVRGAAQELQRQVEGLAATLGGLEEAADQADTDSEADAASEDAPQTSAAARSEGRELAQTLDELDRSIFGQLNATPPEAGEAGEAGGDTESAPQDGDDRPDESGASDSDGTPDSALDASPTLESMLDQQQQEAARQRQQRDAPESETDQPPGEFATTPGTSGDAAGGPVGIEGIDRTGSGWGQLREQQADEVAEGRQPFVVPQYRREIEAYFRAVAKKAAESGGEEP